MRDVHPPEVQSAGNRPMKKPRIFRVGQRRTYKLEAIAALLILAPLVALSFWAFHWEMPVAIFLIPLVVFLAAFAALMGWLQGRYAETARLTVDDSGVRLESEVPRFLGAAHQVPWRVEWSEIDKVAAVEAFGLVQIRRKGFAVMPIAIKVADWVPESVGPLAEEAGTPRRVRMRDTELWRALEERGLFGDHETDARAEALNFDLAKNPTTRAVLTVMAVLAGYWAVDSIMAREAWAEWHAKYILPHVVIGIAGAAIGFVFLVRGGRSGTVSKQVAAPLVAFLGLTVGLASWTGLARINQVVGGPLNEEEYVRNDNCDTLLPVKPELPPIEYTELARGYWCQFPKDRKHRVLVRRGLGGLYQVDMTKHTEAIREYRRARG